MMQSRMFCKKSKNQKNIIAILVCLSLICVNSIPYYAENVNSSDLCVDAEDKIDDVVKEENLDATEEENTEAVEEGTEEVTEEEDFEAAEGKTDEVVKEDNSEAAEEEIDEVTDEVTEEENSEEVEEKNSEAVGEENSEAVEEEIDEVTDEVTEEENSEEVEEKNSEAVEEENSEAVEEKIDEVTEEKIADTTEEKNNEAIEEVTDDVIIDKEITEEKDEEYEVATTSELEETEVATMSEVEEIIEEVATTSEISVKVFWIDSMTLNESGISGSYNYEWDTFTVKEGEDFTAPDDVIKDIKHSNCNQIYKFVGFTTEDQKTKYWLHADYAAGEKMFDKTFPVETDMVVWAVYEAKDTYVSSIKFVDGELTFKTTTIPNIAIKNIIVSDKAFESLKDGYKVLKNGDRYIAYTKDSAEGAPILAEDVKRKILE